MRNPAVKAVAYAFLTGLSVVVLFPYFLIVITAFKTRREVFAYPPHWLPHGFYLGNFANLFTQQEFGSGLLNSVIVCALSTVLVLALAVPAAYAVARLRFPGRRWVIQILLVTQMFAPIVIIVGLFRIMVLYHLIDTLASLIITYAAFNLAFAVWILTSFFETIPIEIEEAAWSDGATRWQGVLRVVAPLSLPGVAVAAIFTFVSSWNDLVIALSFLRSSSRFTATLDIFNLVSGRYTIEWQVVMAAVLVATVPVVIMFAFVRRYIVSGFTAGAIR